MGEHLTREIVQEAIRAVWEAPPYGQPYDPTRPRLVGYGPAECSTSVEVALPFQMVWDCNGYYLALGLTPQANRREIREAYQRLRGWKSPRLTYIVKQLLDPKVRARYDATPFGSLYIDYEVESWLREKERQAVNQLMKEGLTTENARKVLGLRNKPEPAPFEMLDDEPEIDDTAPTVRRWGYAFYLWNTHEMDRERLARWQEALVRALAERGERTRIAVGLHGGMSSPFEVAPVGSRVVVFLHEGESEQPMEALARQAASRVVAHRKMKKSHNI